MHDNVNFSRPKVNTTSSGFIGSNVDVIKSSGIVKDEAFVLTFQESKVQMHVFKDGVWKIERCPTLLNIHCSTIQKDLMNIAMPKSLQEWYT